MRPRASRAPRPLFVGAGALTMALAACGGLSSDPGRDAWLRVSGAEFLPGGLTAGAGPEVLALNLSRSQAARGDTSLHLRGALALSANAVGLWLEGDRGFWLLPAGVPDVTVADALSVGATLGLATHAPLGPRLLDVVAFDRAGVPGPIARTPLEVLAVPAVSGALVVQLTWSTSVDLDLHVVDPDGVEVWAGNPNTWQPTPGKASSPTAWRDGGVLTVDSNGGCVLDGRDQEAVVWRGTPPAGHYLARVEAFALCGQPATDWRLTVDLEGQRLAESTGQATADSTRPPHGLGAGLLAAEFDVP
jgi:hypothetical protein